MQRGRRRPSDRQDTPLSHLRDDADRGRRDHSQLTQQRAGGGGGSDPSKAP